MKLVRDGRARRSGEGDDESVSGCEGREMLNRASGGSLVARALLRLAVGAGEDDGGMARKGGWQAGGSGKWRG